MSCQSRLSYMGDCESSWVKVDSIEVLNTSSISSMVDSVNWLLRFFWGQFYLLSSMVSYFFRFVCRINVVCHEFYILVGPFMVASKMYSWWFEWWNFIYWDQYIMVSTSKIITNIFSTVLKLWIWHNTINNLTIKLHLDCPYGVDC